MIVLLSPAIATYPPYYFLNRAWWAGLVGLETKNTRAFSILTPYYFLNRAWWAGLVGLEAKNTRAKTTCPPYYFLNRAWWAGQGNGAQEYSGFFNPNTLLFS